MSYIGKEPADSFISFAKQDFTTSATTSYTLDNAVANENELALFINFVRQEPTTAYTASGTTLTLTSATASTDDMYCVYLGQAKQTVNAPDGSVGASQLASDAVTAAKLNDDIISGQTALASEPADTDEFLVSDAGTLKRIDYSLIKGGGITMSDQWRLTTGFTGNAEPIASNWERNDTAPSLSYFGSQMTESSGVFTFPSTGIYYVSFNANFKYNGDSRYNSVNIHGCTDGSTMNLLFECNVHITRNGSSTTYAMGMSNGIIDVTDTSNVKVDFRVAHQDTSTETLGNTARDVTYVRFIRLGDT